MLQKILKTTPFEDLILAGALVDGKITQQVAFMKKEVQTTEGYFFDSSIFKKSASAGYVLREDTKKLLSTLPDNFEYQIRTQSISYRNYADVHAESRVGLQKAELEKTLRSLFLAGNRLTKGVGLLQTLPPKSVERDVISGSMQAFRDKDTLKLLLSVHFGVATYLNRVGVEDFRIIAHFDKLSDYKNVEDLQLTCVSKQKILENHKYDIFRYGIKLLSKEFDKIGLKASFSLPFALSNNRLKKEFEFSRSDFQQILLNESNSTHVQLVEQLKNDQLVVLLEKYRDRSVGINMQLSEVLFYCGVWYLNNCVDKHNSSAKLLRHLISNEPISSYFDFSQIFELFTYAKKLGTEVLLSHSTTYSLLFNSLTKKFEYYFWDLPVEQEISISAEVRAPQDLFWITSTSEDFSKIPFDVENIGINIEMADSVNDLIEVLNYLQVQYKIKTVYIKYSLLSHLATIIREYNYKVIAC